LSCSSHFEGVVFSGVGEGAFYVSIYSRRFLERLGFRPYPGTLNVRLSGRVEELNECLSRIEPILVEPPEIPGARLGRVHVYPAEIEGFNGTVYIVRPLITVYKGDVVEFIAKVSLREALNLRDGSIIKFKLRLEESY